MNSLNKTFQTAEKVEEEKSLEVIATKESKEDEIVFNLVEYFEQSIPTKLTKSGSFKEDFKEFKQYLQSYQITPSLLSKANVALVKNKNKQAECSIWDDRSWCKGVFLSAIIQISYNQGFNNFELKGVYANNFGTYLIGKKGRALKIKVGKIKGEWSFGAAKNIVVKIQGYEGRHFGWYMKNGKIYSPNPKVLKELKRQAYGEGNKFILSKTPKELLK